jgi:hypothetical protein
MCEAHLSEKVLSDPTAAQDEVAVVENRGLAGRNGALRLVEGDQHFVVAGL